MSDDLDSLKTNYVDLPKATKLIVRDIQGNVLFAKSPSFKGVRIAWDEQNKTVKVILNE